MTKVLAAAAICGKLRAQYNGVFDCSGFVKFCYSKAGNNDVPHSSKLIWENGEEGDGSAGDIACWAGHVGICDGQGNVIHSYHDDHRIVINSIEDVSNWNGDLLGYRRFDAEDLI